MSDQAAPVYIEPQGSNYAIVASSKAAPPFPDIPTSLVFDIGDLLSRVVKKLPPEKARLFKRSLFRVFSDSHAKAEIKLPQVEGRSLWASFSPNQCTEIQGMLSKQDIESLRPLIAAAKPIEGLEIDDIISFLQETRECFEQATKNGYGLAFFAYE